MKFYQVVLNPENPELSLQIIEETEVLDLGMIKAKTKEGREIIIGLEDTKAFIFEIN